MFLQRRPQTVQFGCYCSVCLGNLIFKRLVPADENQGGDDHKFSQ